MYHYGYAAAAASILLTGCAGLSVTQLRPDLAAKTRTPNGAVYYLPKPYLLVTRLPAKSDGGAVIPRQAVDTANAKQGGQGARTNPFTTPPPGAGEAKEEKGGDTAPTPAGAGTGSSYVAQTSDYVLKLIYLPDRSRPMSITAKTGLFGTAKLSPTLQDGWMLTAFSSEADNKVAEVLQHLSGVITSVRAPGGKSGAPGGPGPEGMAETEVLKPGLYEFLYDEHTGRLKGLCALNTFSARGVELPQAGSCTLLP